MTYHKAAAAAVARLRPPNPSHPFQVALALSPSELCIVYCVSTIEELHSFKGSRSGASSSSLPLHLHKGTTICRERLHASSAGSKMRSQKSILIQVVGRNGKEIIKGGVQVPEEGTLDDLKKAIQSQNRKYYPERQRITLPLQPGQTRPIPVDGTKRLKDSLSSDAPTVALKDLGPQVSYKILFFFEYLGPLFIFPFFYFFPQVYTFLGLPERKVIHPVQTYALYAWCFHYAKRELETFFVHRFSHATSPISNVYRNCAYYWLFGAYIAYFVNHPLYTPVSEKQMYIGFGISVVSQLANFYCHILLKNLRSPDGKGGYQIPTGFLFNFVTCANYTTEIWQWIGFNIATQTVAGYLFLAAAGFIMTVWALQKHKRLKKTFDGKDGRKKYPRRWVIFPPLL